MRELYGIYNIDGNPRELRIFSIHIDRSGMGGCAAHLSFDGAPEELPYFGGAVTFYREVCHEIRKKAFGGASDGSAADGLRER